MANLWLDLKGPILADTVYIGGTLVAKDVTIALPAVTPVTADFKAMGTYTAPILGQIEAMEASITKIGIDLGLRNMMKLESKTIEIRWAQDVKQADGSTKTEGCKAFLRCVSKGIPGLSVDPGNTSENEATFAVSRYQLYVGGAEYRELGLYAEDPDPEVGEVLYCYGNCGDLAEWIPPSGGATIVEKTIDIVTAIGTATNVTAYIPADAYATKEDYETYKAIALGAQATAEEALALARQAIAIAQAAEASVNDLSNVVGRNTSKIATLWDAVFSEITTNPFQITFADLTGITLTAGIWNSGLQRLEC